MAKRSVLFVCLGNICRSPMAEAIFLDLLTKSGRLNEWTVDSAAILDMHVGKRPYALTMRTLLGRGIPGYEHRVRQVSSGDFLLFDYIFGMDDQNIRDLRSFERLASDKKRAKVELLGSYDPKGEKIILDPYYSNDSPEVFEQTFDHCLRSCEGFLAHCYAK